MTGTTTLAKWLSGIAFLLGLWLIGAPFAFGASGPLLYSGVAAGVVIAVLAAYAGYREYGGEAVHPAVDGLTLLAGLWAVATPFVFAAGTTMRWADVVAGILVAAFAAYTGYHHGEFGAGRGSPQA